MFNFDARVSFVEQEHTKLPAMDAPGLVRLNRVQDGVYNGTIEFEPPITEIDVAIARWTLEFGVKFLEKVLQTSGIPFGMEMVAKQPAVYLAAPSSDDALRVPAAISGRQTCLLVAITLLCGCETLTGDLIDFN
eukprot:Opistho-2@72876